MVRPDGIGQLTSDEADHIPIAFRGSVRFSTTYPYLYTGRDTEAGTLLHKHFGHIHRKEQEARHVRLWGLEGATVAITGASTGIGAAPTDAFDSGAIVPGISRTPDKHPTTSPNY